MTTIKIKDLEVFGNHGVSKEENILGQKFLVSAEIDIHTRLSDDIETTVNYAEVCGFIAEFMAVHTYSLIETAAAVLAREIMIGFAGILRVRLEIKKPFAPIKMSLAYVSAEVEEKWHRVFLSIGSNMGDRRMHLNNGLEKLGQNEYTNVINVSSFIETPPVGYENQNDFLNGCVEIETLYAPFELLGFIHSVENSEGRERTVRWGPRTLDIDIIYYDDRVIKSSELTIPHSEAENREFVLKPLAELAPEVRHPVTGKTAEEMLAAILPKDTDEEDDYDELS